jgi:hypothetical protein
MKEGGQRAKNSMKKYPAPVAVKEMNLKAQ